MSFYANENDAFLTQNARIDKETTIYLDNTNNRYAIRSNNGEQDRPKSSHSHGQSDDGQGSKASRILCNVFTGIFYFSVTTTLVHFFYALVLIFQCRSYIYRYPDILTLMMIYLIILALHLLFSKIFPKAKIAFVIILFVLSVLINFVLLAFTFEVDNIFAEYFAILMGTEFSIYVGEFLNDMFEIFRKQFKKKDCFRAFY